MTELNIVSLKIHLPPKFDRYGNRQVWFFETGNRDFDEALNGGSLALTLSIVLLLLHGAILGVFI